MNDPKISALIRSLSYRKEKMHEYQTAPGTLPFVTISRQAGAGGRRVGRALIDLIQAQDGGKHELFQGWAMYDKTLCRCVAEDPKLKVSLRDMFDERYRTTFEDMMNEMLRGHTYQDLVLRRTFKAMLRLAMMGKVVLIGRGGSCLTAHLPYGLHFRIVASEEKRIHNQMRFLDLNEKEARATVKRLQKDRQRLIRDYFRRDIDDPMIYDAIFNKDHLTTDEIAHAMFTMLNSKIDKVIMEQAWTHPLDPMMQRHRFKHVPLPV